MNQVAPEMRQAIETSLPAMSGLDLVTAINPGSQPAQVLCEPERSESLLNDLDHPDLEPTIKIAGDDVFSEGLWMLRPALSQRRFSYGDQSQFGAALPKSIFQRDQYPQADGARHDRIIGFMFRGENTLSGTVRPTSPARINSSSKQSSSPI